MSKHPESCKDPINCRLSYREHLLMVNLSATAVPSRRVNRTEGHPDEPVAATLTREKRWDRDIASYRRLYADGVRPRQVDGSAHRERHGDTLYDVQDRPLTVDYNDAR